MFYAHGYTVRRAHESDDATLAWLATRSSQPPLRRPALIGDVDGMPAAAISLVDGRVVEDPFTPAAGIVGHRRLHRSGWRVRNRRDAARKQVRAAIPFMV
jgi:hypothetical protein